MASVPTKMNPEKIRRKKMSLLEKACEFKDWNLLKKYLLQLEARVGGSE